MPKNQITTRFKTTHQLWSFAQKIQAVNIQIIVTSNTLICDCSEEDMALVEEYGGTIVENNEPGMQIKEQ